MRNYLAVIIIAAMTHCAFGAENGFELGLGCRMGTQGLGFDAVTPILDNLHARMSYSFLPYSKDGTKDEADYSVDLMISHLSGLVDWFPFGNNFRCSGGFVINNSSADGKVVPTDTTDIGDGSYSPFEIGTIRGDIEFSDFNPYLGIGFGNIFNGEGHFKFVFDAGMVFEGNPNVSLTADGALASDPGFRADLKKEEDDIQDYADSLAVYPVISFGVVYRF
jgi:hypothetical protein